MLQVDHEKHLLMESDRILLLRRGAEVWNTWRAANPTLRPIFRGENLNGANLSGFLLRGADLGEASLGRANLAGAIVDGADLSGADLGLANLIGASLIGANLSRADLADANLSRADLDGSDLSGADITGANFCLANLSNTLLSDAGWRLHAMRGRYLGVRGLESSFGNALFKRAAADQDFLDTLEAHLKAPAAWFWRCKTGDSRG